MGRPPLPPEQRRDAVLRVRTTQAAYDHFVKVAAERGYTKTAAIREALADWINKRSNR